MIRWIQVSALATIAATCGLILTDVISGPSPLLVSVVVASVAAITAMLVQSLRLSLMIAVVVGGGAVSSIGASLAVGTGSRSLAGGWFDAVVHGWAALVTSPVPADSSPRLLVPIAIVVWTASTTASLLALRSSSSTTPLVPVLAAFTASSVAAGAHHFLPLLSAAVILIAASLFLVARDRSRFSDRLATTNDDIEGTRRPLRTTGRGSVAAGAGLVIGGAAITVTALALSATLTFGRDEAAFDPRDRFVPPSVPVGNSNPLDDVARARVSRDDVLFIVRSDNAVHTRLVVLDSFDGRTWSPGAGYVRTGSVIRLDPPPLAATADVSIDVELVGLDALWVPSVGMPTAIEGREVLLDPSSGALIAADAGSTERVTQGSYSTSGRVVESYSDTLESVGTPSTDEAIAATELPPSIPTELQELVDTITAGADSPFVDAALIARFLLSGEYRVNDSGAGGHSYGHMLTLLTETKVGTSEQFATAFALLGRAAGLPTRVSIGFGPGEPLTDGRRAVRSSDMRATAEVLFAEAGWVEFPATPSATGAANALSIGPGDGRNVVIEAAPPAEVESDLIGESSLGDGPSADLQPPSRVVLVDGSASTSTNNTGLIVLLVGLALAGLAVLAGVATMLTKRQRTRARRQLAAPSDRVLGAWHETLDRLTEAGATGIDVATVEDLVDNPLGSAALAGLYRPLSRVLYGTGSVSDADAEQAWRAHDRFIDDLRRRSNRTTRVRRMLDPRVLVNPSSAPVRREPDSTEPLLEEAA